MRILKALALATVPVVGALLCVLLFQISAAVVEIRRDEQELTAQAAATLAGVQPAEAEAFKVLHDSRLTLDNVNRAAIDERLYFEQTLPPLMQHVDGVVTQTRDTLAGLRQTSDAATLTLDTAGDNLRALLPVETQATATLDAARAVITSPAVADSLQNLAESSASLAEGTKQSAAILTDAREEADKLVHPPKKKLTFWAAVMAAAGVVHKFEPPIF